MSKHTRSAMIRADEGAELGTFEAVLFTDGEASDGHILSMDGAELPEKLPMFVNHGADPRTQVGLMYPRMEGGQVVVRGEILMDGEGAEADIRRDLALKVQQGHVTAVSGRWDPPAGTAIPRSKLPEDHPARVSQDAKGAKRFGLLFPTWRALEGSIVGLGSDPQAVMRFARDANTSEAVRGFWAEQAASTYERDAIRAEVLEQVADIMVPIVQRLDVLEASHTRADEPAPIPAVEDASLVAPATHEAAEQGGELIELAETLRTELEQSEERIRRSFQHALDTATGRDI